MNTNQRGSEFIDGVALEEYADEQDDYAQEREIEACIKAVDVDCDGKIGECVNQPASPAVEIREVVTDLSIADWLVRAMDAPMDGLGLGLEITVSLYRSTNILGYIKY